MESHTWDRRLFPRLRLLPPFNDWTVSASERFILLDVGLGGFSLEARSPLSVGETHPFAFNVPGGRPVMLRGIVRHCRRLDSADAASQYIAGVEFVCTELHEAEAIAALVKLGSNAEN